MNNYILQLSPDIKTYEDQDNYAPFGKISFNEIQERVKNIIVQGLSNKPSEIKNIVENNLIFRYFPFNWGLKWVSLPEEIQRKLQTNTLVALVDSEIEKLEYTNPIIQDCIIPLICNFCINCKDPKDKLVLRIEKDREINYLCKYITVYSQVIRSERELIVGLSFFYLYRINHNVGIIIEKIDEMEKAL